MKKNCCYGCPDRSIDCHDTCKKYIQWCKEHAVELEKIKKSQKDDRDLIVGLHKGTRYRRKIW